MVVSNLLCIEEALQSYGYSVIASPIEGEESLFVEKLEESLYEVVSTFKRISKQYEYRGKSKVALKTLHDILPNPGFGIVVDSI